MIFNTLKKKSKFERFLIFATLTSLSILIISCIKFIIFGSVNYDEPIQKIGLNEHLDFLKDILKGNIRSYESMFTITEWYGIGLRLIFAGPMLILKNFFKQEGNPLLLYISLRSVALLIYIILGIVLYYTSNLYQSKKSKILPLIYFTFPLLAGESYLNIKDPPFAICFTIYSLTNGIIALSFQKQNEENKAIKKISKNNKKFLFWRNAKILNLLSFLTGALLINSKASMVVPIILIETVLAFFLADKGFNFYENTLNLIKKFFERILVIFSLTYLITPAAWIEPFKYYSEVIKGFAKFSGFSEARINGIELTTNTDSWNLFEYLWRWFQIKLPIVMIILVFIFVSLFIYKLITKIGKYKEEKILNPILIFYSLQLLITPFLAILANSSSYNALRHWCFVYPPLIVFSAYVVDNYLLNSKVKKINFISKIIVVFFSILGNIDNVLMMPYSNISFNAYGRRVVNSENTDIDYYGYSAGELLRKKSINGYIVKSSESPIMTGTSHSPHHIKNENHKYPFAYGTIKNKNMIKIEKQCKDIKSVRRNLLFRNDPITISKIGVCPIHYGTDWDIWSTNNGQIKVDYKKNKKLSLLLPENLNVLGIKRIKEEKVKNDFILSIIIFNNNQFSIEEIKHKEEKLYHKSYSVPIDKEIQDYTFNFIIPNSLLPFGNHGRIEEWKLGFNNEESDLKSVYKNSEFEIVSIKQNLIGIICNRRDERGFRTILKDKSGQRIVRGLDNLNYINNSNIKPAAFYINKVECIYDEKDNIKNIYVFDTNQSITYRWKVDLNGVIVESKIYK